MSSESFRDTGSGSLRKHSDPRTIEQSTESTPASSLGLSWWRLFSAVFESGLPNRSSAHRCCSLTTYVSHVGISEKRETCPLDSHRRRARVELRLKSEYVVRDPESKQVHHGRPSFANQPSSTLVV